MATRGGRSGRGGSSTSTGNWRTRPPRYDATVEPSPDGARVTVTARTLLRDLVLYPDRLDPAATADQALVTLLPGESATFVVSGLSSPVDPAALTTPPVLRCVND